MLCVLPRMLLCVLLCMILSGRLKAAAVSQQLQLPMCPGSVIMCTSMGATIAVCVSKTLQVWQFASAKP